MRKIKIIIDSTSDLGKEVYEKHDIEIVPIYVILGDNTYKDYYEMDTTKMFAYTEETGIYPKTAAASPLWIYKVFKKYYDEGYDIIYTGISSKLSSTYSTALTAAREIDPNEERIFLFDSENLSTGVGLLVLKIIKYRDQGLSAKEIRDKVKELVPNVKTQFTLNTLEYMQKGGRCSAVVRYAVAAFRFKPVIKVNDGLLEVARKPIGFKRSINSMLLDAENAFPTADQDAIFVTYSSYGDWVDYLVAELKKIGYKNVYTTLAGATICTHCGPQCVGILYIDN